MKLTTLKPRVAEARMTRVKTLSGVIGATPRQRGEGWMKRRAHYLRAHPLCAECERQGRVAAATEVDHINPLVDGGADHESNFQGLCGACHRDKSAREASERAKRNG